MAVNRICLEVSGLRFDADGSTKERHVVSTRITSKLLKNLNETEWRQVWKLNFGPEGDMHFELGCARDDPANRDRVFMIKDGDKILSWALVMPPGHCYSSGGIEDTNVYIYTRATERRKGYGTRLIKSVRRKHGPVRVHPHDKTSIAFFNSLKIFDIGKKSYYNG